LSAVHTDGAVALVERLLADGVDPIDVLVDVIATAQRAIGGRWQRGEWTVAEEHAATAVSVAATEAVARHAREMPVTHGQVVVACAEREWHVLPAMIISTAARANGWDTTLLGASTPPIRLSQYLHDIGPDATAVSCSILGALPNTRRFIEASTGAGIPVVVGGPAFGPDARRAETLGATRWAPDARSLVGVLEGLPTVVPAAGPLPAEPAAEQAALDLGHHELAGRLRERWSFAAQVPVERTGPLEGVQAVVEDVINQALHAVSAALVTGDPRPVPETATWVADLLSARGARPGLVGELGELLAATLHDYPLARGLVEAHWAG
jgi:methanogenic corrinoid protein MtbC1